MDRALNFDSYKGNQEVTDYTGYRIHLDNFDGPLDLLLQLIRGEQIDIHNIPVAHVCESYLSALNQLSAPDVNLAGEFFVMAATLLQLKSALLLPREETDTPEEDPRLPLVAQLLEYERFKKAAIQLEGRPWLGRDLFARPEGAARDILPPEAELNGPVEPVGAYELILCLKVALDRSERKPIQITLDTLNLRERVAAMIPMINSGGVVSFESLLPSTRNRRDIILTFLAVLELARLKFVEITQHDILGPIYLRSVRSFEDLNMATLEQF